ncbi:MAG: lipid-A-disaccharide synthase [Candidatus Melainabacteria bacterium]|nr:lipid-A-disaccharide synthase [Candidatus Melainabacteria bacterium]
MTPNPDITKQAKSLFVSVGDISADEHTARLVAQLHQLLPELHIWGMGGPKMDTCGAELLYNCQHFACVGVVETLKFLPFFARLTAQLVSEIGKRKPDAVLLVDFGGFNLRLAQALRAKFKHLPIIYFISPQVWASRPWRMKVIAKTITKMLVIFPFEEPLYLSHGVDASFVGHPLTESLHTAENSVNRRKFCQKYGLNPNNTLIGIFPGSRRREIKDLLPVVLQAANWLLKERPELQFAISQANALLAKDILQVMDQPGYAYGKNICLIDPADSQALMTVSDLLWAKSGTTTLEAALLNKPTLIYYRGNWLSFLLFLTFKQVKYVGWPNILAGHMMFPELLQLDCRAEKLVRYSCDWLDVPGLKAEIARDLCHIGTQLGQGNFVTNATRYILEILAQGPKELATNK